MNQDVKRTLKSKKGITPILATLLLVVIAVATIVVTYAWVMAYTTTQTQHAGTRIKIDSALIDTGNVTVYVRNNAEETAVIDKVYIDGKDFTMYTNLPSTGCVLLKDKTVTILTTQDPSADFSFTAGVKYKIKVVTTVGDIFDEFIAEAK